MRLRAVVYVSSATASLRSPGALDSLLHDARNFNALCGVTGVLLHTDGNFFQYFEGPQDSVSTVYQRIKKSSGHQGLIELFDGPIEMRVFTAWTMGFAEAAASEMQSVAQARWSQEFGRLKDAPAATPGLALLRDYWARVARLT